MDEPTTGLDAAGVGVLLGLLADLGDAAALVVTHDPAVAGACTARATLDRTLRPTMAAPPGTTP